MVNINDLKFDEKGLIPAIVVDANSKRVLTLAYMNKESVNYENLLESIRQMFREEVQMSAEILSPPSAMSVDVKLTEEQKLENDKSVLEALDVFG